MAATPVAQLVVDIDERLVESNTKARAMFGTTVDDLGRPFSELELSRQPVELRPRIEQAFAEGRPVVLRDVTRVLADGRTQFLEVIVSPLCSPSGVDLGTSITFADVTELGRARDRLRRSAGELQIANDDLQAANIRLETSNEELQSSNEELETTNEELQSSNEELETVNEELRSTNDELGAMNEQLLRQAEQIEAGERFLAAILDSLVVGVAVVGTELDVQIWNHAAEDLFGVRHDEAVGRSILALDIGLPIGSIAPSLHDLVGGSIDGPIDLVVDAVNRRGQPLRCRVTVGGLSHGIDFDPSYVVLMDPLPGDLL